MTEEQHIEEAIEWKAFGYGEKLPDFELIDLDGKTICLSDYKAKFVILDFWISGCGSCLAQVPYLKKIYDTFAGKIEIIAINFDQTEEDGKSYVIENEIPWVSCCISSNIGKEKEIDKDFLVYGYPTIYLVGPGGVFSTELPDGEYGFDVVKGWVDRDVVKE